MSISSWNPGLVAFGSALVVSLVATPVVRACALRWRLGDKPNGRKLDTRPIPHLGGIALFLGVLAALFPFIGLARANPFSSSLMVRAIPVVLLIVALGVVDDMRNLRARHKLMVQVLAACGMLALGYRLFTGMWMFDAWVGMLSIVSLIFIVGMLSSINLIDGHDGLAAGVSIISAATFAVIGWLVGVPHLLPLALAVCGACLGFLVFNFPPGRIYMGDTGSMLLGLLLAIMACLVSMRAPSPGMFAAVVLVLGVPLLDTVLAIARRIVVRAPVFSADHLHMHHILRGSGLSPRRTLFVLYAMQVFFCLLGVGAAMGWVLPVIVGLGFTTMAFIAFLRMMVEEHTVATSTITQPITANTIPFKSTFASSLQERRTSVGR
ncbi:MAG TPA: MraY family glycosyltransferase [Candidatus Krumholzibacteria bacterium]|nr:MraY family glycosyltransferase [Candidatus Krumholzibacteria bacterium]